MEMLVAVVVGVLVVLGLVALVSRAWWRRWLGITIADVRGLEDALQQKAPANHTHALGDLSDVELTDPEVGAALRFTGAAWSDSQTAPPTPAYQVITPADWDYLGVFHIPAPIGPGKTTAISKGLALRYVSGRARLILGSPWHNVPDAGEFEIPAAVDPQGTHWAPQVASYPNLGGSKRICTDNNGVPVSSAGNLYGLYWDEQDSRLYWHYANEYEASAWHTACFGYSVLTGTTISDVAAYRPAVNEKWGAKMMQGGMVPIPAEFAKAHLGSADYRLALGMGGYFSVVTMGPASMGPALTAFKPSALGAHLSHVEVRPLVGYPYQPGDPPSVPRMERNTGYTDVVPGDDFYALAHRNGKGFWTWSDTIHSAGVWIDTPTRKGVLMFGTLGHGRVFYQTSTLQTDEWRHYWIGYDPAKLASVATGSKKPWEIQPDYVTEVAPPVAPFDGSGQVRRYPFTSGVPGVTMGGSPDSFVVSGAAFDTMTGRLYLLVNRLWAPGEGPERYPGVFVYQLREAPRAVSGFRGEYVP